jgi:hypothetical protein
MVNDCSDEGVKYMGSARARIALKTISESSIVLAGAQSSWTEDFKAEANIEHSSDVVPGAGVNPKLHEGGVGLNRFAVCGSATPEE